LGEGSRSRRQGWRGGGNGPLAGARGNFRNEANLGASGFRSKGLQGGRRAGLELGIGFEAGALEFLEVAEGGAVGALEGVAAALALED